MLETPEDPLPPPYRGGRAYSASVRATPLTLDLSKALVGHKLGTFGLAELRVALRRQPLAPYALPDIEYRRVWMATWLALLLVRDGDILRARVALETTLETIKTPAYRAMLLAHLAQHAAFLNAPALAKKWLRACPDVAVAEVTSEMKAARLMIAWSKGRVEEVREKTGGNSPGAGFVGGAVALAIALNLAAHERVSDPKVAQKVVVQAAARNLLLVSSVHATAFQLVPPSLVPLLRRARIRDTVGIVVSMGLALLVLVAFGRYDPRATSLVGSIAIVASTLLAWTTFAWRMNGGHLRATMSRLAIIFVCGLGATTWLQRHLPPASAPTHATDSPAPPCETPQLAVPATELLSKVIFVGGPEHRRIQREAAIAAVARGDTAEPVRIAEQCVGSNWQDSVCQRIVETRGTVMPDVSDLSDQEDPKPHE